MGRGPAAARPSSGTARHQQFRARAKTRVDDLQEMFSGLQSARKESRSTDAAVLEAQLHQMLREWRAELSVPSPASSLQQGNNRELSDPPSETLRLLQLAAAEEEDDATSKLVEQQHPQSTNQAHGHVQGGQDMKPEPREEAVASPADLTVPQSPSQGVIASGGGMLAPAAAAVFHDQMYYVNQELTVEDFLYDDNYKMYLPGSNPDVLSNLEGTGQLEYPQFNLPQELPPNTYLDMSNCGQSAGDVFLHMSDLLTTMSPAPAAFLRPKCALWDCPRPAQGSERWQDYCSMYHADLAVKEEGPPGTMPVIRPRGIDLKDGPLFAALSAKIQGKHVGIPVCEGAATAKSPWNAPELFDLYIFEGESIREWLFFDKPRRAFESGNRKQRSLPDYTGRGWHESRKQVMKDFGGLKRSYYMDPQPSSSYEWHLYEYEINDCDAFALYRLEFKSSDAKKTAKSKLACNPLNEIQQQMVRLSADSPVENKRSARSRTKANPNDINSNIYSVQNTTAQGGIPNAYQAVSQVDQMTYLNGNVVYGPHLPYGYSTERSDFYWSSNDGA
ncbi:transcription factor VOZ1 [Oryza brachyantha]|uniref:transcription factor VOZ1 n=1 Tax=Oryza brachyantha TaxID=4533 RepID=UPI001ADC3941|nr:transcription factor VOZ1 [Oryza brachyantha]